MDLGDVEAAAVAGEGSQPKCPNLRGILRVAENRRVLVSVIPTLTLAIMGGYCNSNSRHESCCMRARNFSLVARSCKILSWFLCLLLLEQSLRC